MDKLNRSIYQYKSYIRNHQINIKFAYIKYIPILSKVLNFDGIELLTRIQKHDESKYSDEEFDAYRKRFFPTDEEKYLSDGDDEEFQKAWKHHYTNNSHHPEYYLNDNNDPINMPDIDIAEMILDWIAMGMYCNAKVYDYWNSDENNKREMLSGNTITKIEKTINTIKTFDESDCKEIHID